MTNNIFHRKSISDVLHYTKEDGEKVNLNRSLSVVDLVALSIAAIIGAGIFSTVGNAAFFGGPAVSLLFVFTAVACGLSALCYAHFASSIPVSGSAYTYSYVVFGEIIAWIIGWALIMEYAVGNIVVAISWSDYFVGFLSGFGIHIPDYLSIDYLTAMRSHTEASALLAQGKEFSELTFVLQKSYHAVENAPQIFGFHILANVPAFCIVFLITALVFIGIQQTKVASNILVVLKIVILLLVIIVGAFYVNPENWSPFAPNGVSGVFKGVAAVFFAYIGFDAISTTAEECKNPQRDIPRAMFWSLLIVAIIYVLVSLVLTGLVKYEYLSVGDPLSYAFSKFGLHYFSGVIAIGAVIAMAGVLLVFQTGQPRIWMSMSRDGLLPKKFSALHPKFRTPYFATIIVGLLVGLPSLFMNITEVTDLTAIGTLFIFTVVSAGVLFMPETINKTKKYFKIPFVNSKFFLLPLWIIVIVIIFVFINQDAATFSLNYFLTLNTPDLIYIMSAVIFSGFAMSKNWSLIPVLGVLVNFYLMTRLEGQTWGRFAIWLAIGVVLYFAYGYWKAGRRTIK